MSVDDVIRIVKLHDDNPQEGSFWYVVLEALEYLKRREDDGR